MDQRLPGRRGGGQECLFNGYGLSFWGEGSALELDGEFFVLCIIPVSQ